MSRTLVSLLILFLPASLSAADDRPTPVTFEADVRPILKAHCWQCHGEEAEPEGSLDARLARLLLEGGDSGPAVLPGNHAESLLFERISAGEMPPGEKKLTSAEIELVARWIDAGARTARAEPDTLLSDDALTDEERSHWSFRPIVRPPLPSVGRPGLVAAPVDAFLLAGLESRGLSFGPMADRATLVRRLSYDLTGLPPDPAEALRFINDESPEAYERLVDRLLASPAYGERWARHWLDVTGYADSDGYSPQDAVRKWAYKYRDYVIRAFNTDKPWDEFLVEQLAGDELLTPPYRNLTAAEADRLIATGMLRMGPDGTSDSGVDQDAARNAVLADTITIVSSAVLGLSVGCAQCHAHRYDPISHEDYHRMRALFEPAYDWKQWRSPQARLVSLWSDEVSQQAAKVEEELKEVAERRQAELDELVEETFQRELAKLPEELRAEARAARQTAPNDRSEAQRQLIKEYPFLNVDRGSVYLYLEDRLRGFNKKWDELTQATRDKRPADDMVRCLTEVPGRIPPTMLFARGDFNQPREQVEPGELAVLNASGWTIPVDDPQRSTSGRRLAYARHLTDGKHPLVARVLVNRFWLHFFGRGLVSTPADFGTQGERPTHPDLLDWLADDFMRGGWKLKRLARMIVTSTAYRQSSRRRDALEKVDPQNRLLGRMSVRRLEAETIRDALLAASGRLSPKMYGPPVPVMPDEVGQIVVGVDTRDSAGRPSGKVVPLGEEAFRRSVYVQVRRSMPLGMLEPFDWPLMTPNCQQRASSTVAPQSLLMMNSAQVVNESQAMAARVRREAGDDPASQLARAWLLAFSRPPSESEAADGLEFLAQQKAAMASSAPADSESGSPGEQDALVHFCHALLISNEFLYVD